MAREADIYALGATQFVIPAGYSLALWVTPMAYEVSSTLKYLSGGSLIIVSTNTNGTTLPGATLAGLVDSSYLLGTAEAINFAGPARYYLVATGATAVACQLRGFSQGF
jgi:hypothetical protein